MHKITFLICLTLLILVSSCTLNRAQIDNSLKKHFDSAGVEGMFSILNNQSGTITLYNMEMDTQRILPGGTFSVVNTLIGIQTSRITNEDMEATGDTALEVSDGENKQLNLTEAFRSNATPYFQNIARRIGKDTMKFWVDSLQYGNKNLQGPIDSFWLNNHLKISPDEQLGLMFQLYFDKLPFTKYAQQIVRKLMLRKNNTLYKLSYQTGSGLDEKNNPVGWAIGWIEENRHVYFFVTLIKSPKKTIDANEVALHISQNILKEMGFFKGEK